METSGYFSQITEQPKYAHIERGGLIPINAHILNSSSITEDETVEYKDVQLGDIIIVGYIIDYKVYEAKVKILIWDQSGSIEITFFNGNENQETNGLNSFNWDGKKNKVVKIFGTVKVYKKEKNIQGAKIILLKDNDIFYHVLQVMNSWLYLTGRLQELKKGHFQNELSDMREIAKNNIKVNFNNNNNNNNFNNGYFDNGNVNNKNYENNPFENAKNVLNDFLRKGIKFITKGDLNNILIKNIRSEDIGKVVKKLLDDGFLMEDEENYLIC